MVLESNDYGVRDYLGDDRQNGVHGVEPEDAQRVANLRNSGGTVVVQWY
jgi:hypothetical protein